MAACEEGDGNSDGRFDCCDRAGLLGPLLRAAFRGRFVPVFALLFEVSAVRRSPTDDARFMMLTQ